MPVPTKNRSMKGPHTILFMQAFIFSAVSIGELPIVSFYIKKNKEVLTMKFRIGHGYDVHQLVEGRKLIIGGVDIPYEKGLLGHSDADVLVHAVIDSLFGAAALGDIGTHFPDTSSDYKDADSIELLKACCNILYEKGYSVSNVDATVIAQKPKLKPYIEDMRKNIAAAMGVDTDCVSVKATTEEKLGFTGRMEGISAHCVALINCD